MRNLNWAAGAAAACVSVGLIAISATAANAASLSGCASSERDVRAAIAQTQDATKVSDAQRQARYGLEFCNHGLYRQGMAHYTEALKILSAEKKS